MCRRLAAFIDGKRRFCRTSQLLMNKSLLFCDLFNFGVYICFFFLFLLPFHEMIQSRFNTEIKVFYLTPPALKEINGCSSSGGRLLDDLTMTALHGISGSDFIVVIKIEPRIGSSAGNDETSSTFDDSLIYVRIPFA